MGSQRPVSRKRLRARRELMGRKPSTAAGRAVKTSVSPMAQEAKSTNCTPTSIVNRKKQACTATCRVEGVRENF